MSYYWIVLTLTWLGTVRLQYISTGGPGADTLDNADSGRFPLPLPYASYFNIPNSRGDLDDRNDDATIDSYNHFAIKDLYPSAGLQRHRRTIDIGRDQLKGRRWQPNSIDIDKTFYYRGEDKMMTTSPFIVQGLLGNINENETNVELLKPNIEKRSFSPWGGKRSEMEHTWTWKRSANIKEPNMPKRVRFSPWGGKRSGQVIYKPGTKGSKIIFSSSVPELTKIVSNYSPTGERFNLAGFQIMPSLDKRHPIRILALSTQIDAGPLREALPFRDFVELLPKFYKPGHPYVDVNMKKDGKRKVKFSAWGGKRSPPIIGPIWTPAAAFKHLKDSSITVLLPRDSLDANFKQDRVNTDLD